MKRIFVAERNGTPIVNGLHVEAVESLSKALARIQITPIPRLDNEKMVPYVSIRELEALRQYGTNPQLEALVAQAWEGLQDDATPSKLFVSIEDGLESPPFALTSTVTATSDAMFERACIDHLKVGHSVQLHTREVKRIR